MLHIQACVKLLTDKGRENGYLTYEELNNLLPEDTTAPEKIDKILVMLDEMGIDLIEEAEARQRSRSLSSKHAAATWKS